MSSTFFQEPPEDGASAFRRPVTARSRPAKSILGADLFSPLDTPAASCTTTSEHSPQIASVPTLDISPTSSSVPLHARKSHPQTARERALLTITYSGNGRVSSSRCDLFGARLRIALTHAFQASTGYSMHWTKRGTPHGHSWWVLTMPARTIGENGFCSLLPTPKASEVAAGNNRSGDRSHETASVSQMLRRLLGTPRTSSGYDSDKFGPGAAPNPRKLIYTMPPTPTACDIRSGRASPETMAKNSRQLSETSGALGLTGTVAFPASQRRALLLGLVLWMMGQGTDFLQACATAPLPRSAMLSSRKSRMRSEKQ
jgi:hypothetical protein